MNIKKSYISKDFLLYYMTYWVEEKEKKVHGKVYIIKDRCKQCGFCIEFCPQGVLQQSEEFNAKGYHPPKLVETETKKCVGCGFCQMICPDFAIFVEREEEEDEK